MNEQERKEEIQQLKSANVNLENRARILNAQILENRSKITELEWYPLKRGDVILFGNGKRCRVVSFGSMWPNYVNIKKDGSNGLNISSLCAKYGFTIEVEGK
jgi:hypothetical protein